MKPSSAKPSAVLTHPVYGNVVIVSDPGRSDCLITLRNIHTNRIYAVTRHELNNVKGGSK